MINSGSASRLSAFIKSLVRFKWLFCLALAVLVTVAATPPQDNPDEQYIYIMSLIDRGDALHKAGQKDAARAKYLQAEKALIIFKANNPLFDTKIVNYRLKEMQDDLNTRPTFTETNAAPVQKPKTNAAKLEAESSANSDVKLLDPGAEPRKVLRLHVKEGDKQAMNITVKISMQLPMPAAAGGGAAMSPQTLKLPAITIPADFTVQSVASDGDIAFQGSVGEASTADEPGTLPQVAQGMKAALSGLKGMGIKGTMTSSGVMKKIDIEGASAQTGQAFDQMKDGMSNMGTHFPTEAVGPGAKWQVQRTVKTQGMKVDQTEDYELVSIDGDNVKIKMTIAQKAGNQKIQSPAMGNVQMNLIKMDSTGSGTMESDLSRLLASTASIDTHMQLNAEVAVGSKKQPIDMSMDMNLGIETK